ncbi:hypothetical protein Tco_1067644 [Tanacetum coccineum]|uniref:Reverse transcriptase domain-containing protein n=1 Tax=Tanacetum coccineum TaxID=301880 RepID=A0ABQ5HFA7_9ASTR
MADNRTLAQLLEAPTEGYEDAIIVLEITVDNFELKHGLLTLVQNKQFFRHDKEDPYAHIRYFNKITSMMKFLNVPSTSAELKIDGTTLILDKQKSQAPALIKAVEEKCVTCGGAHSYQNCPATDGNVYRDNIQEYVSQAAMANFKSRNTGYEPSIANQIQPPGRFEGYYHPKLCTYQGPMIPTTSSSPPKVVERETEVTKETMPPTNNGSTEVVQPPVVQIQPQIPNFEPVVAPMPNPKPSILYPSRRNEERHREKSDNQTKKFYEIFKELSFKISFTDALILMPKFALTLKALIVNKEKLSEMARTPLNEHCSAVILNKLPKKLRDPAHPV